MSLRIFHTAFISLSILLTGGFAGWSFQYYGQTQQGLYLGFGIGSVIALIGLVFYFRWFLTKWATMSGLLMVLLLRANEAFACSVCGGNASSPLVKAANQGVLFLLGVVVVVLFGFACLFWTWAKRSKNYHAA